MMKTIKNLISVIALGIFLVSCEAESLVDLETPTTDLQVTLDTKEANADLPDTSPSERRTEGDDDAPDPDTENHLTEGDDDAPDPDTENHLTEGDDDAPDPDTENHLTEGDDDAPDPDTGS